MYQTSFIYGIKISLVNWHIFWNQNQICTPIHRFRLRFLEPGTHKEISIQDIKDFGTKIKYAPNTYIFLNKIQFDERYSPTNLNCPPPPPPPKKKGGEGGGGRRPRQYSMTPPKSWEGGREGGLNVIMGQKHTGLGRESWPSRQARSWVTILLSISLWADSLLRHMASISSMNRMQGALLFAREKISLSVLSDSPDTPLTTSVAANLMKGSFNSCKQTHRENDVKVEEKLSLLLIDSNRACNFLCERGSDVPWSHEILKGKINRGFQTIKYWGCSGFSRKNTPWWQEY